MKRICNAQENAMFAKKLVETGEKISPAITFSYRGATVVDFNQVGNYTEIWYLEDDFKDDQGNPYILTFPHSKAMGQLDKGSRMVGLYGSDGSYHLLPEDRETWPLIGVKHPELFMEFDRTRSLRLPHPNAVYLSPPVAVTPSELSQMKSRLKEQMKQNKKVSGPLVVGSIFMSLALLIVFGVMGVFTLYALLDQMTGPLMILVAGAYLLLWLGTSIGFGVWLFRRPYRVGKRCKFRQNMVFLGREYGLASTGAVLLRGYLFLDGCAKYAVISVPKQFCCLPDHLAAGSILQVYQPQARYSDISGAGAVILGENINNNI